MTLPRPPLVDATMLQLQIAESIQVSVDRLMQRNPKEASDRGEEVAKLSLYSIVNSRMPPGALTRIRSIRTIRLQRQLQRQHGPWLHLSLTLTRWPCRHNHVLWLVLKLTWWPRFVLEDLTTQNNPRHDPYSFYRPWWPLHPRSLGSVLAYSWIILSLLWYSFRLETAVTVAQASNTYYIVRVYTLAKH